MLNTNTITLQQVEQVLELYEKIIGGKAQDFAQSVLSDLQSGDAFYDGYRFGSKWDYHSKLTFRRDAAGNLAAGFNPNFHPRDRREDNPKYQAALEAEHRFSEAVGML